MALQQSEGGPVGRIGLPSPGVVLKLAPVNGRAEARVRSACVTPGYWKRDDLTAGAFDADGFFRTGDALGWIDRTRPASGLRYDGRTAEDHRNLGKRRPASGTSSASSCARGARRGGRWREPGYITALGIPANAAVVQDSKARERLAAKLKTLATSAAGSAQRVQRFALLTAKLSVDSGRDY
jgi:feruloyl-CoA synthase